MTKLRSFVVYVLALAIANYGVLASASTHAHAHDGWHPIHVVADSQTADAHGHDHDGSAPEEKLVSTGLEENDGVPPHTETGFHSHSTPQFGPMDIGLSLAFAMISERAAPPDPQGAAARHRDKPPFKPPRTSL
ncbi:MAG: hypothetical protein KAH44_27480 [Oricola sp.]|jgi:hypothetical protein|uniref:hypothetical protein n=1 Tax=Hyphococcus sp. TaxID=2038636 RepID=UPI00320BE8AC|nr:hypothetical protein [Oricola sp.]